MAVTMATAQAALKNYYMGVLVDQLNTKINPFYNEIKSSNKDVQGMQVVKLAPYGVNGGVAAGSETGALPQAGGNQYIQFISGLKNFYGTIQISDKAIKASKGDAGSFVRLLSNEMKGLMSAAKFNFGRQIFTDGSGTLTLTGVEAVPGFTLPVISAKYLVEGMTVDFRDTAGAIIAGGAKRRIEAVNRVGNTIRIDTNGVALATLGTGFLTVQDSYQLELTGLASIFSNGALYGVNRVNNPWMVPYSNAVAIGAISDVKIQAAIDYLDEIVGSTVNYISTASGVKRAYQEYMELTRRNVNTLDMKGGFKALSFNGLPLVNDRFMPAGTMDLHNTKEYTFHSMNDWEWMNMDGGTIFEKVAGFPLWTATIAKYAELICDHPGGQGRLTGITEV